MSIKIVQMNHLNTEEIFEFENKNRRFFESMLPPRDNSYFNFQSFTKIMNDLLEEQENNYCQMYIIHDENEKMVGRINLQFLKVEGVKEAELGYRIGEEEQGKGYAKEAVRLVCKEAFEIYGIKKIVAGTAVQNIASQKVLEKNGFVLVEKVKKVLKINGDWIDGLVYHKFHK